MGAGLAPAALSSPVTSTDYETAADATETSSYFSAQGYLSRWGHTEAAMPASWQSWALGWGWRSWIGMTESKS